MTQRPYWLCQFAGWGLFYAVQLYGAALLVHLPWARAAAELALLDGLAFGFSHALRGYVRRHRWGTLSVPQMTARIVAASFLLALPLGLIQLETTVSALQDASDLMEPFSPALRAQLAQPMLFSLHVLNWTFLFIAWLVIYFTANSMRQRRIAELRQSELARSLQLAELRLLKTQLNPHFLFNSLNTVRSLIADDPAAAQRAVTHLANTLRYTLTAGRDELVTLAQELAIVRDYLALERMRFEDRLSVEFVLQPEADSSPIPVMLLQTVVENAIKHGIAELPAGGKIKISTALRDAVLHIQVDNPRPCAQVRTPQPGIGLRNADERLKLLFGAGASVQLDLADPGVATAHIRIPRPS